MVAAHCGQCCTLLQILELMAAWGDHVIVKVQHNAALHSSHTFHTECGTCLLKRAARTLISALVNLQEGHFWLSCRNKMNAQSVSRVCFAGDTLLCHRIELEEICRDCSWSPTLSPKHSNSPQVTTPWLFWENSPSEWRITEKRSVKEERLFCHVISVFRPITTSRDGLMESVYTPPPNLETPYP